MKNIIISIIILPLIIIGCKQKDSPQNTVSNKKDTVYTLIKNDYIFNFSLTDSIYVPKNPTTQMSEIAYEIYNKCTGVQSGNYEDEAQIIKKFKNYVKRVGHSLILKKNDGSNILLQDSLGIYGSNFYPNCFQYFFLHYFPEAKLFFIIKDYNCPGADLLLVSAESAKIFKFPENNFQKLIFSNDFKELFLISSSGGYISSKPKGLKCFYINSDTIKEKWLLNNNNINDLIPIDSNNIIAKVYFPKFNKFRWVKINVREKKQTL